NNSRGTSAGVNSTVLLVTITLLLKSALGLSGAEMNTNPLLHESSLPYNYPLFDQITDDHFAPAIDYAMQEQIRQTIRIADNPDGPTFENTVIALERSGQTLDRVMKIFGNLSGTHTNPKLQQIEKESSPKLAAHSDSIRLNLKLFQRIEALHSEREKLGLDAESKRLIERYYLDFVRAGAKLLENDKTKLKAINSELAALRPVFSQNVLKEVNASAVLVENRQELEGLSENAIAAAAAAAKASGHDGKYLIVLMNTSGQPPLAELKNRALRERIFKASLARNSKGGEFDNREVVSKVAKLRAERATLLGYQNHAVYELEEQTARTVDRVSKMLGQLAPAAVANARKEATELQKIIDQEKGGFQLEPWDWSFYTEKARKARFAFDESEIRPYLEMKRVLVDGVFFAATKLYGLTFKERTDLPLYHPDTSVYEVSNEDGSPLAIFIVDWYARPSKRGGAWMNAYVSQNYLLGSRPVIANHLNIPKPPEGEPTLLTWDQVNTAFHEFGHALHGMFSAVRYPRFSGTAVPRDFVEFPSQVNEMWTDWPAVLENYARHYKTGERLPRPPLEKVLAASKFNQGFATTEYLAAALLDQAWHQLRADEVPSAEGVLAFEVEALKKAGVDFPAVPPRYRSTYFSHIFASGYSAGYYSYIWSEVLDADTVDWFKANGGLKRENGDRFRTILLSRGGSVEAMDMFRTLRGREPEIKPLLDRRGLMGAE
ncbi:MAG TPA: M3 family metallopeptidase, partial [Pyrinomonadaceae bacterium]|nr:M3 family metallopeptidase [Pyrinomonadaceae bacterium]